MRRVGSLLALVIMAASALPATAGDHPEERHARRAHDLFAWETVYEDFSGIHRFHIALYDYRDGWWRRAPGFDGELRATVTWLGDDGQVHDRKFSSMAREGYEPFAEGPAHGGFNEGILVGLPQDFGDVSAVIDFWAELPDVPSECPGPTEPGPCGAVEGYYNQSGILLVTNPSGLDAADAVPLLTRLR